MKAQLLRHGMAASTPSSCDYTRSSQSKVQHGSRRIPKTSSLLEELLKELIAVEGGRVTQLWGCGYWYVTQVPVDGHTPMCIWVATNQIYGVINNNNKRKEHEAWREMCWEH